MSTQIFRNGPPVWVLEERRQKAVDEAETSSVKVSSDQNDGDGTSNSEFASATSQPRTSSPSTL